jgi:hypothetical protein
VFSSSTDIDFNGLPRKALAPTNSTFRGITIVSRFECANAFDSIRFNDDGDSNEIDERYLQYEKHDDPRIWINFGMTISFSTSNPRINLESTMSTRK